MGTKKNNLGVRIAMAVIGIALTAASVGLQKISGLGVDPFSVIIFGFSNAFHATYQTVYIVVCAVLLIIAFIFNRKLLGIATVVNLFFSGFVTDATRKAVVKMVGEHPSMAVRVNFTVDCCDTDFISSALYYSSELGVSPYDAQALTITEKTKFPFRAVRISTDVVMLCGRTFALGGDLGLATLVYAFCMGPFIQFCREHFTDKMAAGEMFHK